MRKSLVSLTALAAGLVLAGCGGGGGAPLTAAPPPAPVAGGGTPPPSGGTQTGNTFNIDRCLSQPFGDTSVLGRVIPDVVQLDLRQAPGFPNGRLPQDAVIDITLSAILLDQNRHTLRTLANIPLNPPGVDRPISTTFPYLAPPQGTPPIAPNTGSNFNFRTDPDSAFVRVDSAGNPAVATALIVGALRNAYNDSSSGDRATSGFASDLRQGLIDVHNQLNDDLQRLGLSSCSIQ